MSTVENSVPRSISPWVECFVLIKFDLDIGPKVDYIYPPNVLTEKGERVLLHHAFPDCNVNTNHNFIFFFSVEDDITVEGEQELNNEVSVLSSSSRVVPPSHYHANASQAPLPLKSGATHHSESSRGTASDSCPATPYSPGTTASSRPDFNSSFARRDSTTHGPSNAKVTNTTSTPQRFLYGTVYFRQKKDSRVHRGYVQQAVVLLSRLNYYSVAEVILRVVVPKCAQCCPESPDCGTLEHNPSKTNPNDLRVVVDENNRKVVLVGEDGGTGTSFQFNTNSAAFGLGAAANSDNVALVASPFAPTPCNFNVPFDPSFNNNNYTQEDVLRLAYDEILRSWPSPHPRAVYHDIPLLSASISFVTPGKMRRSAAGGSFNNKNANFFNSNNNAISSGQRASMNVDRRVSFIEDNKFYASSGGSAQPSVYIDPYYLQPHTVAVGTGKLKSKPSFYTKLLDTIGLGEGEQEKGDKNTTTDVISTSLAFLNKSPVESEAFPLCKLFKNVLHYLTRIWELLLWNESLLVLSSSPAMASAGALGVASLLLPIQYNGIIKSYFTVQNADYNLYSKLGNDIKFNAHKSIIIAVTNPYFVSHFSGWRSLLVVMDNYLVESAETVMNVKNTSSQQRGNDSVLSSRVNTTASFQPVSQGTSGDNGGTSTDATTKGEGNDESHGEEDGSGSSSLQADRPPPRDEDNQVAAFKVRLRSSSSDDEADERLPPARPPQSSPSQVRVIQVPTLREAATGSSGVSSVNNSPKPEDTSNLSSVNASRSPTTGPSDLNEAFTFEEYRKIHRHTKETAKKSIHKSNVTQSRSKLQHDLTSHFDTKFNHFLLDHHGQTKILLRRLEAVSKFGEEGQKYALETHKRRFFGFNAPKINSSANVNKGNTTTPEDMRERDFNTNNTNNINYLLFSQFSIADEIIRKYFSSLTTEFLSPITVWYRSVMYNYCSTFDTSYLDVLNSAAGGGERNEDDGENASADRSREKPAIVNYEVPRKTENREENLYRTVFQLCDKNFLDKCLLSPAIFLAFFDKHHRQVAPSLWTANHNYKSYKLIYESFCNGILFVNFLYQLIDESLNEAFQHFEVDVFLTYYPTEQSRIDFFITIYKYLQALVEKCIDPDVLQVRAVTSVLAAVASSIEPPLREHFMNMIEGLRL